MDAPLLTVVTMAVPFAEVKPTDRLDAAAQATISGMGIMRFESKHVDLSALWSIELEQWKGSCCEG